MQEVSFAKIFYSIAGRGRTGVVTIRDPHDSLIQKQIYFLSGDSAFVMHGPIDESLGQILLREKIISDETLEEVLEELAVSDKNIGDILLDRKMLDQGGLARWLDRQVEIKLVSCFALNESLFEFEETTVAKFGYQIKLFKINPERVVYLGVKSHYNLKRLESELELVKDKWLKLGAKFDKAGLRLSACRRRLKLAHSIGKGKAFSQIVAKSSLALADTLKILYTLLVTGAVDITEQVSLKDVKEPGSRYPNVRRPSNWMTLSRNRPPGNST